MCHVGEGCERGENRLLHLGVLAQRWHALEVLPGDVVDLGEGHPLLGVHLGHAAVGGIGVGGLCRGREVHELQAHVDHIAAVGLAVRGLEVDAHHGAPHRRVDVGDA